MEQKYIKLYNEFARGGMDRRVFLERLTEKAGGAAAAAAALLPLLQNSYAQAQTVPENDPRLNISREDYDAGGVKMGGYLARLAGNQRRPAVHRDPRKPRPGSAH